MTNPSALRTLTITALACALSLLLACAAGVPVEPEDDGAFSNNAQDPGFQGPAPDPAACGGECGAFQYTLCTCGSNDPCGWGNNGVCDLDVCGSLITTPFPDDKDCADNGLKPDEPRNNDPGPGPDPDPDPGPDPGPDPDPFAGDCAVTLCLTGAIDQNTPSNQAFSRICERREVPGLIPDCDRSPCQSTFDNFLQDLDDSIYPALFEALDTNGDGLIDRNDQGCEVNILGFSWGGVNAIELVDKFVNDDVRVSPERAFVHRLILLDAYQPLGDTRVPRHVGKVRSYRHSVAPANDCSSQELLGPYLGLAPRCSSGVDCVDYDYSLAGSTGFQVYGGGTLSGSQVDHCAVPSVAHEAVIAELNDTPYRGPLPPTVPVARP